MVGSGEVPDGSRGTTPRSLRPATVIAAAAGFALALRLLVLSRPGYLSGFTQYDDGVYSGNALRLVHGAIAYPDFAVVQSPGSMLLMAPAALIRPQPYGLAPRRPHAGEDAAEPGASVEFDGVLVANQ